MSGLIRAVIDTHALQHNLGIIRARAGRARVMAVVKANAYGHGLMATALALQAAIAAVLFAIARCLPPETNLNYAYRDPIFHRAWGPAPARLAAIFVGAVGLLYWPTHLLLSWMFPLAGSAK